jgi:hypothetical protein
MRMSQSKTNRGMSKRLEAAGATQAKTISHLLATLDEARLEIARLATVEANLRKTIYERDAEWMAGLAEHPGVLAADSPMAVGREIVERAERAGMVVKTATESEMRAAAVACPLPHAGRVKMPDERRSDTVTLRINDRKLVRKCPLCEQPLPESPRCSSFTLHVGFRQDGTIGEFFIRPGKEQKTDLVASLADGWATSSSGALQSGMDIAWLIEKAMYSNDESAGTPLVWEAATDSYKPHPAFRRVSSVIDYAARVLDRIRQGKPATELTAEEVVEKQKLLARLAAAPAGPETETEDHP